MKRSLLLMAIVLSVLVLSDHWLRQGQLDELDRHGVLRPLLAVDPEMVPDRVHQMVLSLGTGQTFTYVREGELWRFPEYHNALAHSDRIEGLLRLSLGSVGTFRSIVQGGEIAEPPQLSMQVDLYDRGKQILTKLQFAGPISGAGGSHNLARVVGSDSVLTLHANPIRVVGRGRPPLLDPHLLPRSLPRGTLTRVEMESEQGSWSLQRVLAPRTAGGPPMPMEESQRYRWVAHHGGRVDTCHSSSVFAYLDFLNRLPVDELTTTDLPTHAATRLRLIDEEGVVDELVISGDQGDGSVAIHNQRARIVGLVPSSRATWIIPPVQVLIDSLPQPSPFAQALQSTSGATP